MPPCTPAFSPHHCPLTLIASYCTHKRAFFIRVHARVFHMQHDARTWLVYWCAAPPGLVFSWRDGCDLTVCIAVCVCTTVPSMLMTSPLPFSP